MPLASWFGSTGRRRVLTALLLGSLLTLAPTARALGPASVHAQVGEPAPTEAAGPRLTLALWDLPAGYEEPGMAGVTEGMRVFGRQQPGPGPFLLASWARVVSGTRAFISGDRPMSEQALGSVHQNFAQALGVEIQALEELPEVGFGREALGYRFRLVGPGGSAEGASALFTSGAAVGVLLVLTSDGSAVDALRQYGPIAEARMDRELVLAEQWPAQPSAEDFDRLALLRTTPRPNDLRGALAAQNETVRLAPDNPDYYFRRARLRRELGDPRGALADLEQALRLGNRALYYLNRALVRADLGDRPGALVDLEQARVQAAREGDAHTIRLVEEGSAEIEGS